MKKLHKVFIAAILTMSFGLYLQAQPQFPCAPGTECPPAPAACSQQDDCIPTDPEPPVGDAIPLDGASSILLLIGAGLAAGKRIHFLKSKKSKE